MRIPVHIVTEEEEQKNTENWNTLGKILLFVFGMVLFGGLCSCSFVLIAKFIGLV